MAIPTNVKFKRNDVKLTVLELVCNLPHVLNRLSSLSLSFSLNLFLGQATSQPASLSADEPACVIPFRRTNTRGMTDLSEATN